jgi:hypothetical protein
MVPDCGLYVPPYAPPGAEANCYIIKKQYYQGSHTSGTLIKTVQTDYQTTAPAILPIRETTTWNQQSLVSKTETDYDSYPGWTYLGGTANISASNPVEKREFDYTGVQVRTTDYGYLHLSNPTYLGLNILDKEMSRKIYAGSSQTGTLSAQTLNTYDGVAISGDTSANPAPNHDYTNFPASYNFRGNLTQVSRGLKSTQRYLDLAEHEQYVQRSGRGSHFHRSPQSSNLLRLHRQLGDDQQPAMRHVRAQLWVSDHHYRRAEPPNQAHLLLLYQPDRKHAGRKRHRGVSARHHLQLRLDGPCACRELCRWRADYVLIQRCNTVHKDQHTAD